MSDAGEGLIEPLKAGEKRLLSYASDQAVLVAAQPEARPQRVSRISIATSSSVRMWMRSSASTGPRAPPMSTAITWRERRP